jgi:predicted dehydrogenase
MNSTLASPSSQKTVRLGFAGVGWIGVNRMKAALQLDYVEAAALFDPSRESIAAAQELSPGAALATTFEELLEQDIDAVVIATPSALHASQSIAALERGLAVFCQKPLARTQRETDEVIAAARAADRLLATDLSYRHIRGVDRMRDLIRGGELGTVYAADLTFHNAYGPDKPWFFDYAQSGGGCLIDLGTHLIDLSSHLLGPKAVPHVESQLFRKGRRLEFPVREVEDFALVNWNHADGASVRIACSWNLSAGREAVIEAVFYGAEGAVTLKNENGSFFDFTVERYSGTHRELLAEPDRGWSWGGGAIREFVIRLSRNNRYNDECESLSGVANILDRSYGR